MNKAKILFIFGIIVALTVPLQFVGRLTLDNGKSVEESGSYSGLKTSALIVDEEDKDEFLEGTMDNLTIDGSGNLKLNINPKNWTNMNPSTKPSAREWHSMAYDSAHDRVVLFGGYDGSNLGDTWVYNLTDNTWTNMTITGDKPSARYYSSMVYDSAHNRTILFGGGDSTYDGETWVYNLTDNTWTNMNPSTAPSARFGHSMAYDSAHDRVVLFGGYSGSYNDDTWVYNLTDNTWTEMTPASAPGTRYAHAMAYDSALDRTILFGGTFSNDETWVYNLSDNTWTNMNPSTKPSGRECRSMVYDSAHNRTILFGGADGTYDDETWVYNLSDNTWTNINPSTAPSARFYHTMVYNSGHDRVVLFGGFDGSVDDETWVYSDKTLFQQGLYTSKVKSFESISTITGGLNWTHSLPPSTSLKLQIGFSNTTHDADFIYTSWQSTNFTLEGTSKYMKYRAIFESDLLQIVSPLLNKTTITYTLETIGNGADTPSAILGYNLFFLLGLLGLFVIIFTKKHNR